MGKCLCFFVPRTRPGSFSKLFAQIDWSFTNFPGGDLADGVVPALSFEMMKTFRAKMLKFGEIFFHLIVSQYVLDDRGAFLGSLGSF